MVQLKSVRPLTPSLNTWSFLVIDGVSEYANETLYIQWTSIGTHTQTTGWVRKYLASIEIAFGNRSEFMEEKMAQSMNFRYMHKHWFRQPTTHTHPMGNLKLIERRRSVWRMNICFDVKPLSLQIKNGHFQLLCAFSVELVNSVKYRLIWPYFLFPLSKKWSPRIISTEM